MLHPWADVLELSATCGFLIVAIAYHSHDGSFRYLIKNTFTCENASSCASTSSFSTSYLHPAREATALALSSLLLQQRYTTILLALPWWSTMPPCEFCLLQTPVLYAASRFLWWKRNWLAMRQCPWVYQVAGAAHFRPCICMQWRKHHCLLWSLFLFNGR
jgi:hypothetical protein